MEVFKAIVLKSTDYKDADKIITLFSLEKGKINVILKNAKNANSKQKFAFQPFCFAEYSAIEKNNFLICTSVDLIDSFFDITADYDVFLTASKFLEIISNVAPSDEPNILLFTALIEALKVICYDKVNHLLVLSKFFAEVFKSTGYDLSVQKCPQCNLSFKLKVFIDEQALSFVCNNCKSHYSTEISFSIFNAIRLICLQNFENLASLKIKKELLEEVNLLFYKNYCQKFNIFYKKI